MTNILDFNKKFQECKKKLDAADESIIDAALESTFKSGAIKSHQMIRDNLRKIFDHVLTKIDEEAEILKKELEVKE